MNDVSRLALKQKRAAALKLPPADENFIADIKAKTELTSELDFGRKITFGLEALFNENVALRARVSELEAENDAHQQMLLSTDSRTRTVFDVNRQVALQYIADQQRMRIARLLCKEDVARERLIAQQCTEFALEIAVPFAHGVQSLFLASLKLERSVGEGLRQMRLELQQLSLSLLNS